MTKYPKTNDGEGTKADFDTTLRFACCDCALVHDIQFHKVKGGFDVVYFRHKRATGQLRRHNYGELQKNKNNGYRMERSVSNK